MIFPYLLLILALCFNCAFELSFYVLVAADEKLAPSAKKLHPGISSSIISELTDCNAALSQQRKKRQVFFVMIYNCTGFGNSSIFLFGII